MTLGKKLHGGKESKQNRYTECRKPYSVQSFFLIHLNTSFRRSVLGRIEIPDVEYMGVGSQLLP